MWSTSGRGFQQAVRRSTAEARKSAYSLKRGGLEKTIPRVATANFAMHYHVQSSIREMCPFSTNTNSTACDRPEVTHAYFFPATTVTPTRWKTFVVMHTNDKKHAATGVQGLVRRAEAKRRAERLRREHWASSVIGRQASAIHLQHGLCSCNSSAK